MFINPMHALQENWIKGLVDEGKQVQPNAIDFTLDILKEVNYNDIARITESEKQMRSLLDIGTNARGEWILRGGTVYDGTSNVYIEVPEGAAAVLFTRSTFARNGVFIVSGLYDSGYKGHIGFTIYPVGGQTLIAPGTRIGQVALISANSAKQYAGSYNHKAGTHYAGEALDESKKGQTGPNVDPSIAPFGSAMKQGEGTEFEYVDPPIGGASKLQRSGHNIGQRQIPSDPRRTETGMGPIPGGHSDFI